MSGERECNGPTCRARILFVTSPATGKKIPVNAKPITAYEIDDADEGEPTCTPVRVHLPHHATCPDVEHFRRQRR